MPKRPTGSANAVLQPGRTKHQRDADRLLTGRGFVFERRTNHGSNLYFHPDGRSVTVNGTPSNPQGEYDRIRRQTELPMKGDEVQSKTEVGPAAQYVALADQELFRDTKNRADIRRKQSALVGWMRRVLERCGPVISRDMMTAGEQMGFSYAQLTRARTDGGIVAYTIPGAARGKGKGQNTVYAALDYQVPEEASVVGRRPKQTEVSVIAEEESETVPEPPPAPEPGEATRALSEILGPRAALNGAQEGDVAAAALLLLESLGVKKPGDEAREALRQAEDRLDEALQAVRRAIGSLA